MALSLHHIAQAFALTALIATGPLWAQSETPTPIDPEHLAFFENQVRPVLAEHCYSCHGPEKQKAGLRLDSRAGMLMGGESGPVLVPGNADGSKFIDAIRYGGKITMPPDAKLPEEAINALTQWVALGAPWPGGDSAAAVVDPKQRWEERVADARATHWAFKPVVNPPVPEVRQADWAHNEIDRFILAKLEASKLPPNGTAAKPELLRRVYYDLIGLPPSAEEIAAFVNDARPEAYAEVVERLLASPRYGERWARYWMDLARYSDTKGYVFQEERDFAFSHTFRDFVIRAFNEDTPFDLFLRYQIAADQMDLGDRKWPLAGMGYLTLGRRFVGNIHDVTDDRIDVVTRGMMGMTVQCARCHDHKYDPISGADYYAMYGIFRSAQEPGEFPLIETPDENDPQYQAFQTELKQKQEDLETLLDELHVALLADARRDLTPYLAAAAKAWDMDAGDLKLVAKDAGVRWQLVERWRDYIKNRGAQFDPIFAPWHTLKAIPADAWAAQAPGALAALLADNAPQKLNSQIATAFRDFQPASFDEAAAKYGEVLNRINTTWTEILLSYNQIHAKDPASTRAAPAQFPDGDMEAVRQLLYGADSPANVSRGDTWDLNDVPTQNRIRDGRNTIARVQNTHPGRPDRAMTVQDSAQLFDPYVFLRGKPDNKGPDVKRRNLEVLGGSDAAPFTQGSGRLELAHAITSRDNPLTARVLVNRVWMHHFGQPIVSSPSDFGLRSNPPSHPELLDWLAWDFMEHGWSLKHLHRRMVHSMTYRQSSADRADGRAADSENVLLWRQNRRRLDFESLRDSILAAAGTLDTAMGGPSVEITTPPFTTRRTVYSRIERQNLPGMFRTFDMASPDAHSPRRFETTVPQQALYLMNSPFVNEQARMLGTQALEAGEHDLHRAVGILYERVLRRAPNPDEQELARSFVAQQSLNAEIDASSQKSRTPAWEYGYGQVDEARGTLPGFTPFAHYNDGTYSTGPNFPNDAGGWASLTRTGGHPGEPNFAVVRRWISPLEGTVTISGEVEHPSPNGEGINAYIVSSRGGIVWQSHVFNTTVSCKTENIAVQCGDTLDMVVSCGASTNSDGFRWHPKISLQSLSGTGNSSARSEWLTRKDFDGPPSPPPPVLDPMAKLAQVILMTNEFVFVD
ncbi:MAG: DUF1553 domain-containing protein [Candidatus Hydrogenedentes bacterium]|nr:DUF1553 domain-containing protein [Candidatus Hydrogenedentota bacterium]